MYEETIPSERDLTEINRENKFELQIALCRTSQIFQRLKFKIQTIPLLTGGCCRCCHRRLWHYVQTVHLNSFR